MFEVVGRLTLIVMSILFSLNANAKSDELLLSKIQTEIALDNHYYSKDIKNKYHDKVSVIITSRTGLYHETLDGYLIKKVEDYYKTPVLFYVVNNYDEVINTFKYLQNFRIKNLFFMGLHGSSYERVTDFSVASEEMFGLQDLHEAGIKLRFVPGAMILTDACQAIERGTAEEVRDQMLAWKKIGFESGWIYMNHTNGNTASLNVYGVPITTQIKEGKWRLVAARFGPGFYFMYKEAYEDNQGYLLGVSKTHWSLYETRYQDTFGEKISGKFLGGR